MTRLSITLIQHWTLQTGLAAVAIGILLHGIAVALTRDFPEVSLVRGRTAAGHPYLSGGISFDERRLIENVAHLYNLKLIFARMAGTPATPAFVLIGANDGGRVEKIRLGGPWLYIRLPPGGYTILARFKSQLVLLRDVNIGSKGRKTYVLRGE